MYSPDIALGLNYTSKLIGKFYDMFLIIQVKYAI